MQIMYIKSKYGLVFHLHYISLIELSNAEFKWLENNNYKVPVASASMCLNKYVIVSYSCFFRNDNGRGWLSYRQSIIFLQGPVDFIMVSDGSKNFSKKLGEILQ